MCAGSGVSALPFLLAVARRTRAVLLQVCTLITSNNSRFLLPRAVWCTPASGPVSETNCDQTALQNMCLALGSIAALALPVLAGWLPLWIAVTLHEGSTLLVALNSLRLLSWPENAARNGAPAEQPEQQQQQQPQQADRASDTEWPQGAQPVAAASAA
jgi:hypothetical protein